MTAGIIQLRGKANAVTPPPTFHTLTINKFFDTTSSTKWADNPDHVAWEAVLTQVITDIQNNFACPFDMQVDIIFGYKFVDGIALGGSALGSSVTFPSLYTYAQIKSALQGLSNKNSMQTTAYAALPSSDPLSASGYSIVPAQASGLGLSADAHPFAGYSGFGDTSNFDHSDIHGTTCAGGVFSLYGAFFHEITEVLGRVLSAGSSGPIRSPGDLFTYSASGVRNDAASGTRYASHDGGNTVITRFDNTPGNDVGDYDKGANGFTSSFDSTGTTGAAPSRDNTHPLKSVDWQNMTLTAGWELNTGGQALGGL